MRFKKIFLVIIFLAALFGWTAASQAEPEKMTFTATLADQAGENIKLSWTKVDKAATYAVFKDTEKIATVTDVTYTDKNVTDGTYNYQIVALDGAATRIGETEKMSVNKTGSTVTSGTSGVAYPGVPNVNNIDLPTPKPGLNTITDVLSAVINWLLGLGGALALIALIYSGIMYITAGGDTAKSENAKKNIIWAITGIVVVLLCFVIINWVHTAVTQTTP